MCVSEIKSISLGTSFTIKGEEAAAQLLSFEALNVILQNFDDKSLRSARLVCRQFVPMVSSIVIQRRQKQLKKIVGFLIKQLLQFNSPASLKAKNDIDILMRDNRLDQLVRLPEIEENFGLVLDRIIKKLGDLDDNTELKVLKKKIESAIPRHPALVALRHFGSGDNTKALKEKIEIATPADPVLVPEQDFVSPVKNRDHLYKITHMASEYVQDERFSGRFPLEFGKEFSQPAKDLYYAQVTRSYADQGRESNDISTLNRAFEVAQLIENSRFRDYSLSYFIFICLSENERRDEIEREIDKMSVSRDLHLRQKAQYAKMSSKYRVRIDMKLANQALSLISDAAMKKEVQSALMSPSRSVRLWSQVIGFFSDELLRGLLGQRTD
jgi:hypothetical protein